MSKMLTTLWFIKPDPYIFKIIFGTVNLQKVFSPQVDS